MLDLTTVTLSFAANWTNWNNSSQLGQRVRYTAGSNFLFYLSADNLLLKSLVWQKHFFRSRQAYFLVDFGAISIAISQFLGGLWNQVGGFFCTFAYGFTFSSALFIEEKYKILLSYAKTLTNSKNCSLKSPQDLFRLSFYLIGRISWSQPAFGTILRFICTKHVEGGYW